MGVYLLVIRLNCVAFFENHFDDRSSLSSVDVFVMLDVSGSVVPASLLVKDPTDPVRLNL
jgi:hypothetical protein